MKIAICLNYFIRKITSRKFFFFFYSTTDMSLEMEHVWGAIFPYREQCLIGCDFHGGFPNWSDNAHATSRGCVNLSRAL